MHLLSTRPGGFVEDESIVTCLNQTPADIVVLSSADTTLALLAAAQGALLQADAAFPSLRLANVLHLRQNASFDRYADEVLRHARVVIVDHLGSESAWPYGIQQLGALARLHGQALALFSGDLTEDPDLLARGTLPVDTARRLWQYLRAGGAGNARAFLQAAAFHGLGYGSEPPPPRPMPQVALHAPPAWLAATQAAQAAQAVQAVQEVAEAAGAAKPAAATVIATATPDDRAALLAHWHAGAPVVALVFYRSHLLAGNTAAFDDLALALHAQGLNPLPLALDSLKDPLCLAALRQLCAEHAVQLVLNTTAFAALGHGEAGAAFAPLAGDAPVLQVIVSGGNRDDWLQDSQGLRPRDIAMQVVLPEVDGRVITRAISFKAGTRRCPHTQVDLVHYRSEPDRIAFVAELAARWCRLRRLPAPAKRLALVLANYPGSEARIGSGVGLDTPASVIALLRLLRDEGHDLGDTARLPADGDALMRALTAGIANDPAQWPLRPAFQSYALADYRARLAQLPPGMAEAITARWGAPEADPLLRQGRFMIAGLRLGKVFVGIQPARTLDAALGGAADYASYHDADLVPPHSYLAFYFWLRDVFGVDAIAHVGKHGNLEWLPGKSLALSAACWPDAILGPLPHLYPFIVNDPGEGAQAKRRAQAVIIDHLMPPLTRAENHGPMQELERLVDEYYEALLVDLRRAALLRQQILALARQQRLAEELGLPEAAATSPANAPDASAAEDALLTRIDAYLCELKETQIRDGLHVFGQSPQGRQRRDTLLALARYASGDGDGGDTDGARAHGSAQQSEGLLAALAADLLGEGFDPFHDDPAQPWHGPRPAALQAVSSEAWRHHGHTRERLELLAAGLLEAVMPNHGEAAHLPPPLRNAGEGWGGGGSGAAQQRICPPGATPPSPQPSPAEREREQAGRAISESPSLANATTPPPGPRTRAALARIARVLAPRLDACGPQELAAFSAALQGRFVPPGPSGSPSRGRPDVLPTGRNFYTVDTRAIPTRTAWALGEKAAQRLIERHLQEHGDYPRAVGLSVWGTATMRTGGDDIAQALALIGVRPKWAPGSQRVVDFEVIPRVGLHRPRVDVTLRISGLFRDAFPATVQLFDAAVQAVAGQDGEDEADNPIRARILQDSAALQASGLGAQQARQQAGWRIFGAAPGHYGSGLDTLLQHNQWDSDADLAHAWLARGQHAYGQHDHGSDASQMLPRRLAQLDVVLQNQDSREHDLLDSGDYWQFQGGMAAAVRHLSGRQPALYHGDHGNPAQPRVRALREEIARIVRARVTNPKWIAGAMRHGYKGAFEMAATVDYLFGFDATCRVVGDHHYALVADAYALNDATRAFLQAHNPQALADILARLREAIARGLWQQPGDYAARLHELALAHDERMEGGGR